MDSVNIFIDNFDDPRCRAGGEHQWLGDGLIHFPKGKSMNARKFRLLSRPMQEEYDVVGEECTCNKCGAAYTEAHNPLYL